MPKPSVEQRFWSKVDKSDTCWHWATPQASNGYGRFWVDGHLVLAHRFAYELLIGPIPDGLQIDHLCRVRHCVNPDHLEAVTQQVNILRGMGETARNAKKAHCPQGHPYDSENTYLSPQGKRNCRACGQIRCRAWDRMHRRVAG